MPSETKTSLLFAADWGNMAPFGFVVKAAISMQFIDM